MWRRWYIVYLLGGGAFKCMGECIFQFDFLIFNNGDRWWFIYSSELKPVIKLSVVASNILTSINNFTVNFCLNTRILYTDWEREREWFVASHHWLSTCFFYVFLLQISPRNQTHSLMHAFIRVSYNRTMCVSVCLSVYI